MIGERKRRENAMAVYGVDVSEADGNVDWRQMKEKGIGFAMLCAGCGSGTIDLQFRKNAEACNGLGIPCGAYWLSYAFTLEMAGREVAFCLETVEEFDLSLPLCVKYDGGSVRYAESKGIKITERDVTEIVEAFCRKAEETGYNAVPYVELDKRASAERRAFNL